MACHKLSHFNSYLISLETVTGRYRKLRSFQETQVNLSVLLEKTESHIHHRTLNTESLEPSDLGLS